MADRAAEALGWVCWVCAGYVPGMCRFFHKIQDFRAPGPGVGAQGPGAYGPRPWAWARGPSTAAQGPGAHGPGPRARARAPAVRSEGPRVRKTEKSGLGPGQFIVDPAHRLEAQAPQPGLEARGPGPGSWTPGGAGPQ